MENYGLLLEPLKSEDYVLGTDQSLGAKFGADVYINPEGDWTDYMPSTEDQSAKNGDTWACVSFATQNAVEMLARLRFQNSLNLSDRFLAKTSGTIPGQGNSPQKVAEQLRKGWSVLEPEWPDVDTVEEFYAEIPAALKTVALARGAEFAFGYQVVPNNPSAIKAALKTSPVCIAVTAWAAHNDVYVRVPGASENHLTTIIKVLENGNYQVFDSFYPFIKEVSPDACRSIAMSYYLNRQVVVESTWQRFLKWLKGWSKEEAVKPHETAQDEPKPTELTVPTPPPAASHLDAFCEAIKAHEGWFPGSRSFRNNNPGNCRYSSQGYLDIYKPVLKDAQGFAIFKDYATGWLYLQNLVKAKVSVNPSQTILDFFKVYAPAEDNNDPVRYAQVVAKACGLKPSDPVSKIISAA